MPTCSGRVAKAASSANSVRVGNLHDGQDGPTVEALNTTLKAAVDSRDVLAHITATKQAAEARLTALEAAADAEDWGDDDESDEDDFEPRHERRHRHERGDDV